jgi:formamidopyrimidine-DNA glycosylase
VPELPDITVYLEALQERILGNQLVDVKIRNPFFLRTVTPSLDHARNLEVAALRRIGKRIAIGLQNDLWLVIHLMIAGRLHWRELPGPIGGKQYLASLQFSKGQLLVTEAGTRKRASLHLLEGDAGLRAMDRGGLEVLGSDLGPFSAQLTKRNHTLKRALSDPTLFSGIGNAYSDEILHAARLSPVTLTQKLRPEEIERLHRSVQGTLSMWIRILREERGAGFPEKVTAFRPQMAVHGKFGKPCPVCGTAVQRIRYADNETNYCPRCQTGGKLLADRSLSTLLKRDWPRTIDELEELRQTAGNPDAKAR